jgi:alcohol dehydrogenase
MSTMRRVAFFHGPGRRFELVRLPTPALGPGEMLVRIGCCTLCTSDLHTHSGRRPGPTPSVLGHEIVGRIEAFGPDAPRRALDGKALTVGARVAWSIAAACGTCFYCNDGLPQKCERLHKYGHERATVASPFVGGLADCIVLKPGTSFMCVPDDAPDALAALANCATATCAAVLRAGGAIAGRCMLISGAGVLGLTACAMARAAGAGAVLVCDPDAGRRTRASAFGATHCCAPEELGLVHDITGGRGADVVLELAGVHASVQSCLASARIGGTVVLAGTVLPTPAVPLDPERVVRRLLTIRGVHNYAPADLETAVNFLAAHAATLAPLVGPTFDLDDIEQAFAHAHAHPGVRVAVVP